MVIGTPIKIKHAVLILPLITFSCGLGFAQNTLPEKRLREIKDTADLYYSSGNYQMVVDQCLSLQDYDLPNDIKLDLLEKKGLSYRALNDYASAIEAFQECIRLNSNEWKYHFSLASTYEKTSMNSFAIDEYKKVINLQGDKFHSYFELGKIYQEQGLNTQAIENYKQALLIKSTSALYRNLSKCYEIMHDWEMSASMLKQALSLEPSPEDNLRLAMLYYVQAKYTESIYLLLKESALHPEREDIKLHLLAAYFKKGDYEAFQDLITKLKIEYPNDAMVYFLSGFFSFLKNDTKTAYTELKKSDELADTPMLKEYSSYFVSYLEKKQ
ncbi:MAG: tetratricopeptide repeat protein [Elusimicrobia bacterium]|nr:tetratricopeptide repeat protein [Elusimicrobiota bacterium]